MAKPKLSHKDLRKTSFKKKADFYPAEQTDLGKNKNQGTTDGAKRLSLSRGSWEW